MFMLVPIIRNAKKTSIWYRETCDQNRKKDREEINISPNKKKLE